MSPELGSTTIAGIGICHEPLDRAEPATLFTRTSACHVSPPSHDQSNMMSSEKRFHHVRYTVPLGDVATITPRTLLPVGLTKEDHEPPPSSDHASSSSFPRSASSHAA